MLIPFLHVKNTQFFFKTYPKSHFYMASRLNRFTCSSYKSGELDKLSAPLPSHEPNI